MASPKRSFKDPEQVARARQRLTPRSARASIKQIQRVLREVGVVEGTRPRSTVYYSLSSNRPTGHVKAVLQAFETGRGDSS